MAGALNGAEPKKATVPGKLGLTPGRWCLEDEMVNPTDGTKVARHGMFYME